MKVKAAAVTLGLSALTVSAGLYWIRLAQQPETKRAPVTADSSFFQWDRNGNSSYNLVVKRNPQFIHGAYSPAMPESGRVQILGGPGTVQPGAYVELTNMRTKETRLITADNTGAFSIDTHAERGDTFKVFSAKVEFRAGSTIRPQTATVK